MKLTYEELTLIDMLLSEYKYEGYDSTSDKYAKLKMRIIKELQRVAKRTR